MHAGSIKESPLCSVCLQRWACSARLRSQTRCCCESFATPTSSMRSSSTKTTSAPPTTTSTRGANPSTTLFSSCRYAAFQGTWSANVRFLGRGCSSASASKSYSLFCLEMCFFSINLLSSRLLLCSLLAPTQNIQLYFNFHTTLTCPLFSQPRWFICFLFCFVEEIQPWTRQLLQIHTEKLKSESFFLFFLFFRPNAVFIRTNHWVVTETGGYC